MYGIDPAVQNLLYGIDAGNPEIVRNALDAGADPNVYVPTMDGEFYYPLYIALEPAYICSATYEIVCALIEHGADVNARSSNGGVAICLAVQRPEAILTKALVDAGAVVNITGESGTSPLYQSLAAPGDNAEVKQILIDAGADVNFVAPDGYPTLFMACNLGKANFVKLLIEAGANINCHPKHQPMLTPLRIAVNKGHGQVVKILLDNGALEYDRDSDGRSQALGMAIDLGNDYIADLLESYGARGINLDRDTQRNIARALSEWNM